MLMVTTNQVEGYPVKEYKGIVFADLVLGVNFLKDIMASFTDFFGGRSNAYEKELEEGRQKVLQELAQRAQSMGANAILGLKIDYEVVGQNGSMMMLNVSGTAVVLFILSFVDV